MVLMVLCVNKCLGLFFTRYIGHQPFTHANARIPCAVVCGSILPETLEGRTDGVRRGDKSPAPPSSYSKFTTGVNKLGGNI